MWLRLAVLLLLIVPCSDGLTPSEIVLLSASAGGTAGAIVGAVFTFPLGGGVLGAMVGGVVGYAAGAVVGFIICWFTGPVTPPPPPQPPPPTDKLDPHFGYPVTEEHLVQLWQTESIHV